MSLQGRRILTAQRMLRELGRIRTGYSVPYQKDGRELRRAVRSETFVLTSGTRDNLDIAAELWGGKVEDWEPQGAGTDRWRLITEQAAIDAILPPGDPLSQMYEFWNAGGALRRCDGERDEKSGGPCVCRRQFGEEWHTRKKTEVCQPHTRLNVFLQLNDFGYWRIETKSFYALGELAGAVDLIKARIGPDPAVPIRLRIDQRSTVRDGKVTPYPVVVLELRGVATAQILAGVAPVLSLDGRDYAQPAVTAGPDRAAIGAAPEPPRDFRAEADAATDVAAVQQLWKEAHESGALTDDLVDHLKARAAALKPAASEPPSADDEPAPPGPDADEMPGPAFWKHHIDHAATVADLRAVWSDMRKNGVDDKDLNSYWWARKKTIEAAAADPVVDGEAEPDKQATWTAILTAAGERGWKTSEVSARFREAMGRDVSEADGWTMAQFLESLKAEQVAA